jgi:hypothetical protein
VDSSGGGGGRGGSIAGGEGGWGGGGGGGRGWHEVLETETVHEDRLAVGLEVVGH